MKIKMSELKGIVLEVLAEEFEAGHEDALKFRDAESPSKNAKLRDEDKNEKAMKKAREEDIEETEERKEVRNRGNDASLTIHTTDTVVQETGTNRIKMSKKAYNVIKEIVIDENNKQNVVALNIAKAGVNRLGTMIKNSSAIQQGDKASYIKELKKTMSALKSIRESYDSNEVLVKNNKTGSVYDVKKLNKKTQTAYKSSAKKSKTKYDPHAEKKINKSQKSHLNNISKSIDGLEDSYDYKGNVKKSLSKASSQVNKYFTLLDDSDPIHIPNGFDRSMNSKNIFSYGSDGVQEKATSGDRTMAANLSNLISNIEDTHLGNDAPAKLRSERNKTSQALNKAYDDLIDSIEKKKK